MFNISNKTLRYGLVGLVALVLLSLVSGVDYLVTQKELSKIPEDLKINIDKDNIIGAQTISNGKIYDKEDSTKVVYEGEVVKYAYKTEKIIDKPNEVVSKRTKNSRTIKIAEDKEKITYQLEVISGVPQYYEDEKGEWYQADYGTTDINTYALKTKGSLLAQLLFPNKVYATEGTFYPDADPETSTVDGWVANQNIADWSTARSASSANTVNDSDTYVNALNNYAGVPNYYIYRGYFLFYTSSLCTEAIISSAIFSSNAGYKYDNDNSVYGFTVIVSSNPTSNAGLVVGDYSKIGSTELSSRLDNTNLVLNVYNDYVFNTDGNNTISKTGITKLGLREGHDLLNSAPPEPADSYNGPQFKSAENSGTSQDPKLVVTYTVPAGNFFQMF